MKAKLRWVLALIWVTHVACGSDGGSSSEGADTGGQTDNTTGHSHGSSDGSDGSSDGASSDESGAHDGVTAGDATNGSDGSASTDGSDDESDAGSTSSGACTNDADQAAMAAMYGDDADESFDDVVETCGRNNIIDLSAVSACIQRDTENQVSAACADCYQETITCSSQSCAAICGIDSGSADCKACLCENRCPQELATCSGLSNDQCD